MADSVLPPDVVRFIYEHIHSVEQLEVLLLLRQQAQRSWSPADVVRELRTGTDSASRRLEDLCRRKLLQEMTPGLFRYGPVADDHVKAVENLAAVYAERRVSVIETIFARPPSALRTFADAFRLTKGDE